MIKLLLIVSILGVVAISSYVRAAEQSPATQPATRPASVLDFTVTDNAGMPVALSQYQGNVLLIVNTASLCGLTPQYEGLEKIYRKYKDKGLAVLAFPANDFGKQEPGSDAEIRQFCSSKYAVSFDLFSKISVLGETKAPLYQYLTRPEAGNPFAGEIKWNFTKFLISREGTVVARFEPPVTPEDTAVTSAIETELAKSP